MNSILVRHMKILYKRFKANSRLIKNEIGALYIAYRRPDVPIYAKIVAVIVVGYALSPIDLIPDFIPVLGYIDDIIILPLGITLAIRLIPNNILDECRRQVKTESNNRKTKNWIAGGIIIFIWMVIISYILIRLF